MALPYQNLKQPQNVGSGVGEYVLIASVHDDFEEDGIKCPTAPFTNPGDSVKITSPHVFKEDRGFAKIQLAPDKNQLNGTTIGDKGFHKLNLVLDVFIPGSYAELHEQVANMLNKPLIALIKDANCAAGMYYQLGCDCAYAWLTVDFSTGTTVDGVKGYAGKLSYTNGYVQLYTAGDPEVLADPDGSGGE